MVPVDFYRYWSKLKQMILSKKELLASEWDPFVAAWVCYSLAIDGIGNNQPLIELCTMMEKWLTDDAVWDYRRNLGPIALIIWLWKERGLEVQASIAARLSQEIQRVFIDDKLSILRDPEQVFLLALGLQGAKDESAKNYLKKVAEREVNRGPLRRHMFYAASLKELGESVPYPFEEHQDESDVIALVWWAERYGGDKYEQWKRFGTIEDHIALEQGTDLVEKRNLSITEMAILYEAVTKEIMFPEPSLLFEYFPFHERVRQIARDYFMNGKYNAAVFEAVKALNEMIQQRSGIMNKNEAELVQTTMKNINEPRIIFNDFLNEDSGKNEQTGLALICEGIFKAFRNPKGHKPEDHPLVNLEACEALEQLIVISYMMKRIERAKTK